MMDLLTLALVILGAVGLSFEVEDSILSNKVKRWIGIDKVRAWQKAMGHWKFYWELLPKWTWFIPLTAPIVIFLIITAHFLILFEELISCSVCVSFHIAFWVSLLVIGKPLIIALMIGGVATLINRILFKYTL
jgi:hypothetical protein